MKLISKVQGYLENKRAQELVSSSNMPAVYHVHLRKTAGTSLNMAMIGALVDKDPEAIYKRLARKNDHRIIDRGRVIVGWNKAYIENGAYHFAFSHIPWHELNIPSNVITFTCLRDPIERVVSHYKMLHHYAENGIDHPCMKTEGKWIVDGFAGFLKSIPREDLMAQLFCFSKSFNIGEANENLNKLSCVLDLKHIDAGLEKLQNVTGFSQISMKRYKNYGQTTDIFENDLKRLADMIQPEIEFYNEGIASASDISTHH